MSIREALKQNGVAIGLTWSLELNPANKETPHSFKGQQLENELVYRFVIYKGFG